MSEKEINGVVTL